jgi:organic radical activating enzyme
MSPTDVEEAIFYITNVCNLSCSNCVTYSNLDFKGFYRWEDSADKNKLWPTLINPKKVSIYGGEPFLNPDLKNWVDGVINLWPNHNNVVIATNGTLLTKPYYYELAKYIVSKNMRLEVSAHAPQYYDDLKKSIEQILDDSDIKYTKKFIDSNFHGRGYILDQELENTDLSLLDDTIEYRREDNNFTIATLHKKYIFQPNAIKFIEKKSVTFHDHKNAEEIHDQCCAKDCHVILHGNLYKCGHVTVGQDFVKQFEVPEYQANLIKNYIPCDPTDGHEKVHDFLIKAKSYIPHCSQCTYQNRLFKALPWK